MSNLSQFVGGVESRSPIAIVNKHSVAGFTVIGVSSADASNQAKNILVGALTADTLATVLTVSSPGVLEYLSLSDVDGGVATRTIRLQLIIDGVTVWDYTSASTVSMGSGDGVIVVGGAASGASIPFNASMVIKVASSLTETDQQKIGVKYRTV